MGFIKVTVEPLILLVALEVCLYYYVIGQYLYARVAEDFNYHPAPPSINISHNASFCSPNSANDSVLAAEVSVTTSQWVFHTTLTGSIPSFFTVVLIVSWGDRVGRRYPLLLAFFGQLITVVLAIITIYFHLPLYYTLIARFISALFGDTSSIVATCFAYYADESSSSARTIHIAVGEALMGVGFAVAAVISGPMIQAQGFGLPLYVSLGMCLFCFVYILFILPESRLFTNSQRVQQRSYCGLSQCSLKTFSEMINFFSNGKNYPLIVVLLSVCYSLQSMNYNNLAEVSTTYRLSPPLCWSPDMIGFYPATYLVQFLGTVVFLKLFQGCLNDLVSVAIGGISYSIPMLINAFAVTTWFIFAGNLLGVVSPLPAIIFRSTLSKLVSANDQGTLFAFMSCVENLGGLAGSFLFNNVYAATVSYFRGYVYLTAVGIEALLVLFYSVVYIKCDIRSKLNHVYEEVVDDKSPIDVVAGDNNSEETPRTADA